MTNLTHKQSIYYKEKDVQTQNLFSNDSVIHTKILLHISTGMRFALMQVKTGLCHILSRFEVAAHRNTPVPVPIDKKSFLLTVDGELPLTFKRVQL